MVGFGRFYKIKAKERIGRNPRNGKPIKIPAHFRAGFTAGKNLREACNENETAAKKSKK